MCSFHCINLMHSQTIHVYISLHTLDRTENLKRMKEIFDEMDQTERDVTNALDEDQLSGLKTSLEAAFKIDIEVHVHVITITFYAYAQKMPMMIGLKLTKQFNSVMHY